MAFLFQGRCNNILLKGDGNLILGFLGALIMLFKYMINSSLPKFLITYRDLI